MSVPASILIADDESTDQFIWRQAFARVELDRPLEFVSNGQQTQDYLVKHPLPGMLLLDLKMPQRDGFDVLQFLAENEAFRALPVFVFSSSSDEEDIRKARQLGAHDYFIKPHSFEEWITIAQSIKARLSTAET